MIVRRSLVSIFALLCSVSYCLPSTVAADKSDPTGTWTWVRELEGQAAQSVVQLTLKDGKLTGCYKRMGQIVPIAHGKFEKNEVSFDADGKWNDQTVHGKFKGKLSSNAINGTVEIVIEDGSLPLAWVAKRGVDADNVVGTWKLKLSTPNGKTVEPTLKLASDKGTLTGTYSSARFGEHEAKAIKLNGSEISWTVEFERDGQKFTGVFTGQLDAQAIKGTMSVDSNGKVTPLGFSGERAHSKAEASKPDETKKHADGKSTEVAPAKRRVIVMLKSRRETLVVYSAAGRGPAFSIRTQDGTEIAKEISLKDLQASYSQIYETYRTSFANIWAGSSERAIRADSSMEPTRKSLGGVQLFRGIDVIER